MKASKFLKLRKNMAAKIYLESIKDVFNNHDVMNNLDVTSDGSTVDDRIERLVNNSIVLATKFFMKLETWDEDYIECNGDD